MYPHKDTKTDDFVNRLNTFVREVIYSTAAIEKSL